MAWHYYSESQQGAIQREWDGIVGSIDGSVDRKTETMGAGFVVGTGHSPRIASHSLWAGRWRHL